MGSTPNGSEAHLGRDVEPWRGVGSCLVALSNTGNRLQATVIYSLALRAPDAVYRPM